MLGEELFSKKQKFNNTFFREKDTDQRLNKLIECFKKIEAKYNDFKKAVDHAYANQSPPQLDDVYHIQYEDLKACEAQQAAFNAEYKKGNALWGSYCASKSIPESERLEVKEAFRAYGEKILHYKDFIGQEMSGILRGIKYCYLYPTPAARSAYEWRHEAMLNKKIMFGLSNI